MSMRSDSLQLKYNEYRDKLVDVNNQLHKEPSILEWVYWRLVNNRFPYDKIAATHKMIVLKRNCSIYKISAEELTELWTVILPWADKIYDTSILNLKAMRSINGTPHVHLLTYLPEYR